MAEALDQEIEQLQERATLLKKQLKVQTATLLCRDTTRQLLENAPTLLRDGGGDGNGGMTAASRQKLVDLCEAHGAYRQQCLYRTGASITAFRVQDPDPNAVDGGRVLGVRLDVMMGAQFLRPYYVLMHRDKTNRHARRRQSQSSQKGTSTMTSGTAGTPGTTSAAMGLCIHRHTIPPCIPLAGLAARYLGAPAHAGGSADLYGFARALRRAVVRYHNRLATIGDLRRTVQNQQQKNEQKTDIPIDISGADAEAKHIKLDWADGRTGRLVLDDDGGIEQLVVVGEAGGRDHAAVQALLGDETTAAGLVRRLTGS